MEGAWLQQEFTPPPPTDLGSGFPAHQHFTDEPARRVALAKENREEEAGEKPLTLPDLHPASSGGTGLRSAILETTPLLSSPLLKLRAQNHFPFINLQLEIITGSFLEAGPSPGAVNTCDRCPEPPAKAPPAVFTLERYIYSRRSLAV